MAVRSLALRFLAPVLQATIAVIVAERQTDPAFLVDADGVRGAVEVAATGKGTGTIRELASSDASFYAIVFSATRAAD
jgi:hypothetical protein